MNSTPIEKIFSVIDQTAHVLEQELDCTYLEAVAETGENLFQQEILQDEISEIAKKRLRKHYDELNILTFDNGTIRKSYQLAVLKGMKEATQANHQMTPDAVGIFMSYLVSKFVKNEESISILDPAVGTGNLLTTVLNTLSEKTISTVAVDVDPLLVKLAFINANLQQHPIQFYTQDSLTPLLVDPVDVVVCDLPVGYYPNDAVASGYTLHSTEKGHSFAHYLFIEQSVHYTKPGGYLFFLIPNHLFESGQSKELHAFLQENAYIQSVLQLPLSMFKSKSQAKSILILQKKGENLKAPKQVLLAELPKFSDKQTMKKTVAKIDHWIEMEKRES